MRNDLPEIKQGLKDRIETVCLQLLPDGRRQGRLWVAHNPVTLDHDRSPEFKVALDRDIGAWKDWRTGLSGDVLGMVAYLTAGDEKDIRAACEWGRDFLGLRHMSESERRRMAERAKAARAAAERDAARTRQRRMQSAERFFLDGAAAGTGSAAEAHARRYFAGRNCPLEHVQSLDLETFRFAAAAEYWQRAVWRNENGRRWKESPGPLLPAVLSAMRAATGQLTAVHCTFLDPLTPKKFAVSADENAKLMFGEAKGAVIRIAHGPEGLPPERATRPHPLILCEGVEDGVSLAGSIPEARVWAAGMLSNLANAPVWMGCVSQIVVSKDNDWGNRQAARQFDAAMEALERAGKPLATIASHIGKDFNDMMQDEDDE
ncbi:MAG: hypothetical protein CMH13_11160 [Martelella sp.]|uniref:toprim domain-containing protein n=1 Tax=Martelella sp. TaxID=1969699 RepID=UPI000C493C89|nr:toprim domain-containing protein [Martelella sp.]MAU21078.1 hypothetical protein [Martelella sp.]